MKREKRNCKPTEKERKNTNEKGSTHIIKTKQKQRKREKEQKHERKRTKTI